jgi:predicted phage tail protein
VSNEIVVVVGAGSLPAAPQNLAAVVSGNVLTVAWRAPVNVATAPVETYVIEAGSEAGLSNLANFATGSPATQFLSPPVGNGIYYIRLRARNAVGTGPASVEIRVVVGPPPPGAPVLAGSVGAGNSVSLVWTAPTSGAAVTGYQLQAGTAPGSSNAAVLNLPASPLSFNFAGVPRGTYYVRVVAQSALGPSAASNEVVLNVP